MAIPWIDDEPPLYCNRKSAEDRLYSLEKHLKRRPDVAEKYCQVLEANVDKGYIRKLEPGEVDDGPSWYLPHFPVVREDKETTKVRIVYDSAARYGGISLNDTMLPGPKLQQDIFDVLLRFCRNPVALMADLTEMFSQVIMAKKDRRYHRFLWRGLDLTRPPDVYEAIRLMFGDRASPYLAQYVVQQHAEDNKEVCLLAAAIILLQMYMDDIMTSLETEDEAVDARDELIELLGKAGFKIRRWCSNRPKVLEDIPVEDRVANVNIEESELPCMKALGIQWNAEVDVFTFLLKLPQDIEYTKRGFLKKLATLFDPLQMLAPFTVRARMAMQETWLLGLGWDDEFPDELRKKCHEWFRELPELSCVEVPRCYRVSGKRVVDTSIHTMTDASQLAYAAVSYVRHEYEDGEVTVRFVAAKAKVAPTKAISIPRLELMAAVLGLRLMRKVSELLEVTFENCTLRTDSEDVICWIQGQSRRYKTFVANRISEIHQKSNPRQWRHVPTDLNCADDATRGLHAKELSTDHRWFSGPEFLYKKEEDWPQRKRIKVEERSEDYLAEITKSKMAFAAEISQTWLDPLKFSSWTRLIRVTAWVLRFVAKLLAKEKKSAKPENPEYETCGEVILTPAELDKAGKLWVKQAQIERFAKEIKELKGGGGEVSKQSHLKPLTPIVDELGVLRVGGRLNRAELPYDAAHPMILPKKHHITRLVVADVHHHCRHAGVNHVLAQIRNRYWVIDGRQEVKNWDQECKSCERRRAKPAAQIMAPLPTSRLGMPMRAFAKCCVDYAGPFVTKITRRVSAKRYLCLFTYPATRAVHLEMAFSLSTADFLKAFSRMVATRGKPEEVISDNGTNFVGAERELRELIQSLDQTRIADDAANKGIKWSWNPPLGSHFGGVFESLIKVAKKTLKVIVGNAGLNDDELQTAIKEVEALMNSRPLSYEGTDPRDEPVLTPSHFLIGQLGGQLAPQVTDELAFNPRNQWRLIQNLVKIFWKRWREEFLATLNTRKKWREKKDNLKVGDVVLVVDQNAPSGQWPLGRVEEVFPGQDGRVRIVQVSTRGHKFTRLITRLCPLNVSDDRGK